MTTERSYATDLQYEPFTFSTVVGVAGGSGQQDGVGTSARFSRPIGLTIDQNDNLFVADTDNHTIRQIAVDGTVRTIAGTPCLAGAVDAIAANARFNAPRDVAVASDGTLYVADTGNQLIRKITKDGQVSTIGGVPGVHGAVDGPGSTALFNDPSAIAVDKSGIVYVADTRNSTIRKITQEGVVSTYAGTAGELGSADGVGSAARFLWPEGIAVDRDGIVFVADSANHTLRRIALDGTVTTFAGTPRMDGSVDGIGEAARFRGPSGICVSPDDAVYLADDTIRKCSPQAVVSTIAGFPYELGSADGVGIEARFNQASDVAVDSRGNIFVADSLNCTIRKVSPTGAVTTFAGLAVRDGYLDGNAQQAEFKSLSGVAVDKSGNLYVADSRNCSIRKVSPQGVVTTVAGFGRGSADGTGLSARFSNPCCLVVDSTGSILVADTGNNTIRKLTPEGVVTTLAGSYRTDPRGNPIGGSEDGLGSAASFRTPTELAVDSADNLFVADTYNNNIRRITPEGMVSTIRPNGFCTFLELHCDEPSFKLPRGVAVDRAGNIFVADTGNYSIRRIAVSGEVSTFAGMNGLGGSIDGIGKSARFIMPWGMVLDAAGNLYVSDTLAHIIRKITSDGVVTTLGGMPSAPGGVDGTGIAARFNAPADLTLDSPGNLYIADAGNNVIRKGIAALAFIATGGDFGWREGQFGFAITGSTISLIQVEASTDLRSWVSVSTNNPSAGRRIADPDSAKMERRFYRLENRK